MIRSLLMMTRLSTVAAGFLCDLDRRHCNFRSKQVASSYSYKQRLAEQRAAEIAERRADFNATNN